MLPAPLFFFGSLVPTAALGLQAVLLSGKETAQRDGSGAHRSRANRRHRSHLAGDSGGGAIAIQRPLAIPVSQFGLVPELGGVRLCAVRGWTGLRLSLT